MALQNVFELEKIYEPRYLGLIRAELCKLLRYRVLHKQLARILRQRRYARAIAFHLAAIGLQPAGDESYARALARAVAAQKRTYLPPVQPQIEAAQYVWRVSFVSEPAVFYLDRRIAVFMLGFLRYVNLFSHTRGDKRPALPHCQRRAALAAECGKYPYSRRHGVENSAVFYLHRGLLGHIISYEAAVFQNSEHIRHWERLFEPVLRQNDSKPEVLVKLAQR